jgi:predicted metal-dependent phosphoesterase TrpH
LIDLHTHTTASDGRCTPEELVAKAAAANVRVLGVTDHDTMAGCRTAADACRRAGIEFVPGIEVTAVEGELDVHTLGYFLDVEAAAFQAFLVEQRQHRVNRLIEMTAKLGTYGIHLDINAIIPPNLNDSAKSVGRPLIARALVAAGHVKHIAEAFDRWLSSGRPAFVPRIGASPREVIARVHGAGGIASLAHPGLLKHDEWIPGYIEAGLDAIEVYHSDHDPAMTAHYLAMARAHGVLVTGGSDYHADDAHGGGPPGRVSLPADEFERLKKRRSNRRESNESTPC